ncbi:MAG: leucine-rich repeat domain-containing protein [Prevotellaceae bacterium]|nr:leucine-rich repeat domain-containing protein [Prevotellaceae bacterium]
MKTSSGFTLLAVMLLTLSACQRKTENKDPVAVPFPQTDTSDRNCVDGICYNFDDSARTAQVTSIKEGYNVDVVIPSTVLHENANYEKTTYDVTSIGEHAFGGCDKLLSVVIPGSVTRIGEFALEGCESLESIEVASGNPSYRSEDGVLYTKDMTQLLAYPAGKHARSFTIPNTVTYVGYEAFFGCQHLTEVTIGSSVKSIEPNAFHACAILTAFHVDRGNSEFCSRNGVLYAKDMEALILCPSGHVGSCVIPTGVKVIEPLAFEGCGSLISVTIPNSVKGIGWYAFNDCGSLESVTIGESVKSIGENAFRGCALKKIIIPNSVIDIGSCAFFYCCDLKEVTIGKSVTTIGDDPFHGCTSLETVTCLNPTPPVCSIICFEYDTTVDIGSCTLYVPKGSKEKYASADGWRDFGEIVETSLSAPAQSGR